MNTIDTSKDAIAPHGGQILAIVDVKDVYGVDKKAEAKAVFRTEDDAHPGAAFVYKEMGDTYVGGDVTLLARLAPPFPAFHNEPAQTRALFRERGWRKI